MVRLFADGDSDRRQYFHAGNRADDHQRASWIADARSGGGRDHVGLSDGVHADGHGNDVRLVRVPQRQPRSRDAPDSRFDGPAHLRGDVERCVDRNSVVRVHGLPGRARQPDRKAVPKPASGDGARARLAGSGNDRHLRGVCNRHRNRRRGRYVDGLARFSGDAEGRIQHTSRCRVGYRGWLPWNS